MTIGERIQDARKKSGLTQEELGKRVGVTGVAIMRYEKGARQPRLEQLQAIADALNVRLSDLVTEPQARMQMEQQAESKEAVDRVFNALDKSDTADLHAFNGVLDTDIRTQVIGIFDDDLNRKGKIQALKCIYKLSQIPRYTRPAAPQRPVSTSEGTDITPPQKAAEGPQEGE